MVLLAGLYFTWSSLRLSQQTLEETQRGQQQTLKLTEEGQITERFTRAVDQLGSEKLEIRLGGIYALERIARDSERDYWPIMEILTAYARMNAPAVEPTPPEHTLAEASIELPEQLHLPSDIQAILTVLGRRGHWYSHGEVQRLDLSDTDLIDAELTGAHLEGAHLEGTLLDDAFLVGAHLEGASLIGSYLIDAHLERAHLKGADLTGADLSGAHLDGAYLERTRLDETSMIGTYLTDAHLEGADLTDVTGLTWEQLASAITDERTKHCLGPRPEPESEDSTP